MPGSVATRSCAWTSRSYSTSTWSLVKPIGTMTASRTPRRCSASRWSPTSGSSHGTCGGPLRDWKTSSQGYDDPSRSTTPAQAARSAATYAPPSGPLVSAMTRGTEWAVKTRCASGPSPVAVTARAIGARKPSSA